MNKLEKGFKIGFEKEASSELEKQALDPLTSSIAGAAAGVGTRALSQLTPQMTEPISTNMDEIKQMESALGLGDLDIDYNIGDFDRNTTEFIDDTPRINLQEPLSRASAAHELGHIGVKSNPAGELVNAVADLTGRVSAKAQTNNLNAVFAGAAEAADEMGQADAKTLSRAAGVADKALLADELLASIHGLKAVNDTMGMKEMMRTAPRMQKTLTSYGGNAIAPDINRWVYNLVRKL